MARIESTYRPTSHGRAAHDAVTVRAATEVHERDDVDWTVSGDVTVIGYGTIGRRRAGQSVNVWRSPGVTRRRHADVRLGDVITTPDGTGTVTRKGSSAGWFIVGGVERRWEGGDVLRLERPAVTE